MQDHFKNLIPKILIENPYYAYGIMLQLVGLITLVLLATAAIFAWLQNRPAAQSIELETSSYALETVRCE